MRIKCTCCSNQVDVESHGEDNAQLIVQRDSDSGNRLSVCISIGLTRESAKDLIESLSWYYNFNIDNLEN